MRLIRTHTHSEILRNTHTHTHLVSRPPVPLNLRADCGVFVNVMVRLHVNRSRFLSERTVLVELSYTLQ